MLQNDVLLFFVHWRFVDAQQVTHVTECAFRKKLVYVVPIADIFHTFLAS